MTSHPLRTFLHSPNPSGRLVKWATELSEYDIEYRTKTCANSHVLAYFIVELATAPVDTESLPKRWTLNVDRASSEQGSGVEIRLCSPSGELVASHVRGEYDKKEERRDAYAKLIHTLAEQLDKFELERIPRGENTLADALAALASASDPLVRRVIRMEGIDKPSIDIALKALSINEIRVPPPNTQSPRKDDAMKVEGDEEEDDKTDETLDVEEKPD